jgi:hypothetical protein
MPVLCAALLIVTVLFAPLRATAEAFAPAGPRLFEVRPASAASDDEAGSSSGPPPRTGTVGAYHLGIAIGFVDFEQSAEQRGGIGGGSVAQITAGIALWDQLPIQVGFGSMAPSDHDPIFEKGPFCGIDADGVESCSEPRLERSTVSGGYLNWETGYQRRFRLSSAVALVPAGLLGYVWSSGRLSRTVGCEGCRSFSVDVDASGAYFAPSLRFVLGDPGAFGLSVRTNWFLTGDVQQMTLVGLEFLAP